MLYDKLLIQFGYVNNFITTLIKYTKSIKSIKNNRFPLYRENRFNILTQWNIILFIFPAIFIEL